MLENLKSELLGKELDFRDLDNILSSNNFYSLFDDNIIEDIKNDLEAIYTNTESNEAEIRVNFEIVYNNGSDEAEESFILKVLSIDNI
jgi:hypothetical protein